MLRSLLIKLALLAATVALVFWIGWPVPDEPALDDEEEQVPVPSPRRQPSPAGPLSTSTAPLPGTRQGGGNPAVPTLVDVNKASASELERLPGIGPVLAERIVQWRRDQGPFQKVDDLSLVKGIGEKKLRRIRPLVTAGPSGKALAVKSGRNEAAQATGQVGR